jgi:hypothetical protein
MSKEEEREEWGVFIPAQWVQGVSCSAESVAHEVARNTVRGPIRFEVRLIEWYGVWCQQAGSETGHWHSKVGYRSEREHVRTTRTEAERIAKVLNDIERMISPGWRYQALPYPVAR